MGRVIILCQNILYLIRRGDKQLYSLTALCFDLLFKDAKSSLSVFYFSIESLVSVYKYKSEGKQALSFEKVKEDLFVKSKRLFLMGSGPSVNEYTPEEWELIRKSDSWGFNLWFCHDFIPTTYLAQALVEPIENKEASSAFKLNSALKEMLKDKEAQYGNSAFVVRGDSINRHKFYQTEFGNYLGENFKTNSYLMAEMSVSSTNRIKPDVLLEHMFEKQFFDKRKGVQLIPKFGSTVTEMISLGLLLDYEEIVLCGIDMNDGGHFYDNEKSFQHYPYLRELYNINHSRTPEGGHEHMDLSMRPFTIKDYIIAMSNFAKKRFDCNIYVMNESSALYPEIPKFKYNVESI